MAFSNSDNDANSVSSDVKKKIERHHPPGGQDVEEALGASAIGDDFQSCSIRSSVSRPEEKQQFDEASICLHNNSQPGPMVVPRHKRRGLFGRFTVLAEVGEPEDYPRNTKWFITFIVAIAAAAAPLGSNIFFRSSASFYGINLGLR
jgi:hypothetical protein